MAKHRKDVSHLSVPVAARPLVSLKGKRHVRASLVFCANVRAVATAQHIVDDKGQRLGRLESDPAKEGGKKKKKLGQQTQRTEQTGWHPGRAVAP